jgi:hypothetical protein
MACRAAQLEDKMRKIINNIIQNSAAVMIFLIIFYGIVFAQQICCKVDANACIPAINRISGDYAISKVCMAAPSHLISTQSQLIQCSKNCMADFGDGISCCETDRCDSNYPNVSYIPTNVQDCYLAINSPCTDNTTNHLKIKSEQINTSTSHKTAPIYILTQSIVC